MVIETAIGAFLIGGGARLLASMRRRAPSSPVQASVPRATKGAVRAAAQAATTSLRQGDAGGLLLRAIKQHEHEPIEWVDVQAGELVVSMARDAVQARVGSTPIRLPVSYADTIEACKLLGCIAPTKEIVDAAYAASSSAGRLVFHGLVRSKADLALMMSLDFSIRLSTGIDRQLSKAPHPGQIIAGPWKYWILHPRIVERGAVNYGGFGEDGKPIQTVGGTHGPTHYDYSQLFQPVKRAARLMNGKPVDLVDYFIARGLPRAYVEAFR